MKVLFVNPPNVRSDTSSVENEKNKGSELKINPYDNLPLHRKIIDIE